MRNATRQAYNAYCAQIALLSGVGSATEMFVTAPTVQQKLEDKIQESSDFLARINLIGVVEKSGAKVGLGMTGPIASRTDTSLGDRLPKNPVALTDRGYDCQKTDFDTQIPYALLDAWAKFPDFQTRIRNQIVRRQALDRIMIGWNGTSIAPATNLVTNPLLQDVNKGWIRHLREEAPERIMSDGPSTGAGSVKVGTAAGSDYRNLDALVFDLIELLDPWYREDSRLVAIVGRDLLHDKYFPIVNAPANDPATEQLARDTILSSKRLGGLQAVTVPFFPADTIAVTMFDNLSLYYQEGARRRKIEDNPKRDRIENYESSNDAYVVEDNGAMAVVENIDLV